jgi:hypothetical protein
MDFNPQSYAPDGTAIFAKDTDLLIRFFTHPELSQYKSVRDGMPVHDDVIMIEVITPGERDSTRVAATELHKRRFPRQWEAFKSGQEMSQSGTPIDLLFPAEPSTVLRLKSQNVHTIQQLAALSDSAKQSLGMGGQQFQDKARAFLSSAQGGQNFHAMQASMQKQIDDLKAMLLEKGVAAPEAEPANLPEEPEVPTEPVRRGPGRPRSAVA